MPDNKNSNVYRDTDWMIDHAKALQRAAEELSWEGSNESDPLRFLGMVSAEPILLSLALEIALKAWQCREKGAPEHCHDLLRLFEGLEPNTQKRLEARMPAMVDPLFKETLRESLRELLCSHRKAFIKWRYPYEGDSEGSIFKTFDTAAVHQALTVLIDAYYEREPGPPKVDT